MAGSSNITGQESIIFADNASFDGTERGGALAVNGQLWTGSTVAPHVRKGGLTSPDGSLTIGYLAPNITMQVGGGTTVVTKLSDDIGTVTSPTAGIIQLAGHVVEQGATKFSTTVSGSSVININPMSSFRWIVDPLGFNGTHTTIAAATAAASAGDLIGILSGTYNIGTLNLKNGVKYTAISDGRSGIAPSVILVGKLSDNGLGLGSSFTGIYLQTDGDFAVQLTANSTVVFSNCVLTGVANTIISMSNGSANIFLYNCDTDIQTTGISLYNITGGTLWLYNSTIGNSGGSTTSGTLSSGSVRANNCISSIPMATSAVGVLNLSYTLFETINQTCITTVGTVTSLIRDCQLYSGSASAISIGSGTTVECYESNINSTNTNAITGAGTLKSGNIIFTNTSSLINTTIQVPQVASNNAVKVTTPGAYPYTAVPQDYLILVDTTVARTINLNASPVTGQSYRIKDATGTAGVNNITITPAAGNIDGSASKTISSNYGSVDLVYNGTQWSIL